MLFQSDIIFLFLSDFYLIYLLRHGNYFALIERLLRRCCAWDYAQFQEKDVFLDKRTQQQLADV